MVKEQVRSASKHLSPLLRRRGTSPAVGSALRRAFQALDKAMAAPEGPDVPTSIHQALAELRGCMVLIQESDRPADQEQLEGVATALSFLAPLEADLPPPPANQVQTAQAPSVFHTVVPSSLPPPPTTPAPPLARRPRSERKRRSQPALDVGTVDVHLAGLHGCFDTLHAVLNGSTHRLAELDQAAESLRCRLLAVAWLGDQRTPLWVKASREAQEPADRLVASAALVHLQAQGGAERSMTVVERAAQGEAPLAPVAMTVLNTLHGQHFLACARAVFDKTKSETVRALLLPLLVERGALTPDQLVPLVDHVHDGVAIAAAVALAWIGDAQHAPVLVMRALGAKDRQRSNALLFAATALGSMAALDEVRTRVKARNDFDERLDERLIDALAIAGDDGDASLLVDLATRSEANATYALFAAANLGCAETARALPAFDDRVSKAVLGEAKRLILGDGETSEPNPSQRTASGRLLRGQPWSISGLLARLAASDETIVSQRRLALELRVRTGLVPPAPLPSFAPAQARSAALAPWTDHFARAGSRLAAGQWYYQGKPARRATSERP